MYASPRADGAGVVEFKANDGDTIASFAEQQTGSLFSVSDDSGHTKFEVNETGVIDARLSSGALGLPVGATSERPDTPVGGYTRWNSTNSAMEIYNGTDWVEVVTDYFPSGSTNVS